MKKLKIGKFGIGLLIYSGSLVLVMVILIAVLCGFLASFEKNRPERAAQNFVDLLTEEKIRSMIASDFKSDSEFETADTVYLSTPFASEDSEIGFLKKVDEYTAQRPVFYICCGGKNLGKFALEQDGKAAFGMTKWRAEGGEIFVSKLLPEPEVYTVRVPAGTAAFVNGLELGEKYLTEAGAAYSGSVYLSSAQLEENKCDIYTLPGLHFMPSVTAVLGEESIELPRHEMEFDALASDTLSVQITASSDAAVMLCGLRIPEKFFTVTDESVRAGGFESGPEHSIPKRTFCRVLRSVTQEEILATVSGRAMILSREESGFVASHGEESLRSFELSVPDGSEIKINGIALDGSFCTGDGVFTVTKDSLKHLGDVEAVKTYRVTGLFNIPEISVSRGGGAEMSVCYRSERGNTTYLEYYGVPSESLKADAEKRVTDFVNAYIRFTSSGGVGLEENHGAVMAYACPGTKAYSLLSSTKKSYYWAEYHTVSEKELNVGEFIPISENSFFCTVDYTVKLKKGRYERDEQGAFRLLLIKKNGIFKVGEFLFESK